MGEQGFTIILYDGVCHLCNWWVRFLVKRDHADRFRFVQVQDMPPGVIPEAIREKSDQTVIVLDGGVYYTESEAIVKVLKQLPVPWSFLQLIRILPRNVRDFLYRLLARRRYQLFGRYDACPIIPEKWRSHFPSTTDLSAWWPLPISLTD